MKTIFIVFTTDQWLSKKSKEVIGVAHDKEGAITLAKKSGYPLEIKDIVRLTANSQTQGLEVNVIIEEWQVH